MSPADEHEDGLVIGSYRTTTSAPPLAAAWDGHAWTDQSPPLPASTRDAITLTGISCPSPGTCIAVGSSATSAAAQRWNGHLVSHRHRAALIARREDARLQPHDSSLEGRVNR